MELKSKSFEEPILERPDAKNGHESDGSVEVRKATHSFYKHLAGLVDLAWEKEPSDLKVLREFPSISKEDLRSNIASEKEQFIADCKANPELFLRLFSYLSGLPENEENSYAMEAKKIIGDLITEMIGVIPEPENEVGKNDLYRNIFKSGQELVASEGEEQEYSAKFAAWADAQAKSLEHIQTQLNSGAIDDVSYADTIKLACVALLGKGEVRDRSENLLAQGFDGGNSEDSFDLRFGVKVKELIGAGEWGIVEKILERHGLNSEAAEKYWHWAGVRYDDETGYNDEAFDDFIYRNLRIIRDLDAENPETARTLWTKFGIINFARYKPEMLSRQVQESGDQESPYGVVVYPYSDHNGAFEEYANLLNNVSGQMEKLGYITRIVEYGGKIGLAKRFIALKKAYPNKIDFILGGAHGSDERFEDNPDEADIEDIPAFRPDGSRWNSSIKAGVGEVGEIKNQDLQAGIMNRASEFISESAPVALIACQAGAPQGFSTELSAALGGRTVIASDRSSSPVSIKIFKNKKGALAFNVKYNKGARATRVGKR